MCFLKDEDFIILNNIINNYSKIKIIHSRMYNNLPIKIWDYPEKYFKKQLGEGETIIEDKFKKIPHIK